MKFRALVLELHLPQNFCHTHTDTQKDRYCPEIVKSCSGHPKTCKSIENRKSKICTKPIKTCNLNLKIVYFIVFKIFSNKILMFIEVTDEA